MTICVKYAIYLARFVDVPQFHFLQSPLTAFPIPPAAAGSSRTGIPCSKHSSRFVFSNAAGGVSPFAVRIPRIRSFRCFDPRQTVVINVQRSSFLDGRIPSVRPGATNCRFSTR